MRVSADMISIHILLFLSRCVCCQILCFMPGMYEITSAAKVLQKKLQEKEMDF